MLGIPIVTQFNGKGIQKALKSFKQLESGADKLKFVLKAGAVAGVAAFAAIGTAAFQAGQALLSFTNMAAADEKSQKQLALSIKASTKATDAQIASLNDWIDATQRATGVADDDLRPAFARIIRSTGNLSKAQRILKLALDVSAATGKPLAAVVTGLSKSYEGANTALGRLGIGYDKAQLKAMSFNDIQKDLESRFGGSALDAASTYEGVMARFRITVDELKETLGAALLPYMKQLAEYGIQIAEAFGKNGVAGAFAELKFILTNLLYDDAGNLTQVGQTLNDLISKLNTVANAINSAIGYARVASGVGLVEKVTGRTLTPTVGTITPFAPSINPGTLRGFRSTNVTINTGVGDPVEIGRQVVNAINAYERRNGGR